MLRRRIVDYRSEILPESDRGLIRPMPRKLYLYFGATLGTVAAAYLLGATYTYLCGRSPSQRRDAFLLWAAVMYIPFFVPAVVLACWRVWWWRRTWRVDDFGIELYRGRRLRRRLEWSEVKHVTTTQFSAHAVARHWWKSIMVSPISTQVVASTVATYHRWQRRETWLRSRADSFTDARPDDDREGGSPDEPRLSPTAARQRPRPPVHRSSDDSGRR